ncbi:MAG: hypothetical protein V5A43_00195 [Haloarculaceae archaeon]
MAAFGICRDEVMEMQAHAIVVNEDEPEAVERAIEEAIEGEPT